MYTRQELIKRASIAKKMFSSLSFGAKRNVAKAKGLAESVSKDAKKMAGSVSAEAKDMHYRMSEPNKAKLKKAKSMLTSSTAKGVAGGVVGGAVMSSGKDK